MTFQDIAQEADFIEQSLGLTLDDVLNKLTQEMGEFNDAIQNFRGRYTRTKTSDTEHVKKELGDVLFNLISLCHQLGIDVSKLEQYPEATLAKFKSRLDQYK